MDKATPSSNPQYWLQLARRLAAQGDDESARQVYLEALRHDTKDFDALHELATLAYGSGHRSAAKTAWQRAVNFHPDRPEGLVSLATVFFEEENWLEARQLYEAALKLQPDMVPAHQGLARVLEILHEPAEKHWQQGFVGHSMITLPYRGQGFGLPLLLLVCARSGNIPTQHWIDDRHFAVTALYAEFYEGLQPLPPHALIINLIGDADVGRAALIRARDIVDQSSVPVINHPDQVLVTDRSSNARRMADIPGLVAAGITGIMRSALMTAKLSYPLLLRAPGYHAGRHFYRVEKPEELPDALAGLPGEGLLAIEFLDARGRDGLVRKFRVMFIQGVMYPLHLAISADWNVHYFSSAMAENPAYREEEAHFLQDMPTTLGPKAMKALQVLLERLALDFAGVDFALAEDGSVLLFECNATMAIYPAEPDVIWDYRRPALEAALDAARRMIYLRAMPATE
ncbi:MAG: tetratricopeptide repeat protein [Pseudomonadales bacterium]|nr:tetratricopeptide repeat protein [Pseudomonadales bacterium]